MLIIPQVPVLRGTPEEQLAMLRKYLCELTDYLSVNLNNINYTSFDDETRRKMDGD